MENSHPGLPTFDYILPRSLEEASQFLYNHPTDASPFLGGTDLFVRMRNKISHEKYLVDIKNIHGMNELSYHPDIGLTIGAAVNMNRVISSPEIIKHYPVLAEACRSVGSYQLRTRATIVGNICNASPAGDTIGACLLLDGVLNTYRIGIRRKLPLIEFLTGPGETVLAKGEIVTSIEFPVPQNGVKGTYIKLGRNNLGDLAIVGVTAIGYPNNETSTNYQFQLALASVAPTPIVVTAVNKFLSASPITEEQIAQAAIIAMEACNPIADIRSTASYRKYMVKNLTKQALTNVWYELRNANHQ